MSTDKDNNLFRQLVGDVKPLKQNRIHPYRRAIKPLPRQQMQDNEQVRRELLSDHYDPADLETGEELIYLRSGMQHGVLRKLRRGQYSLEGELDLHGLTVPEARVAITDFLHDCAFYHIRCARIIHGKGNGSWQKQPVLKNKLNHWLRQYDQVLAFCSARAVDGGTGAVYVLLKQ
ncbi:Smr/MutS family protein [Candidatus Venteria ishoeyi]|uniref:Putative DNA endonuclease SmrA n=1 Tax=Candidatus Venteria ishoeyi TaxID=1899563 RepID=A0A1H6FET4_9GAMM|nr:Smr/MutS family protein [Candidatus Venteria ishoeyi]MDM8545613.1 Smr/MutS family protein [Candidatus Venteria ishoeyi]SEH06011.1 putative DNA endonuclease SmrA [Candidatus Venteria ishoeyi]SEH07676.1 putative DNA endonuclease SmrA [Candidatus Venteria ishoeyi]